MGVALSSCIIPASGRPIFGLGATPLAELFIVFRRVAKRLSQAGIHIHRSYVGEYSTSLEMAGCSGTLLRLDDELRKWVNWPVSTTCFTQASAESAEDAALLEILAAESLGVQLMAFSRCDPRHVQIARAHELPTVICGRLDRFGYEQVSDRRKRSCHSLRRRDLLLLADHVWDYVGAVSSRQRVFASSDGKRRHVEQCVRRSDNGAYLRSAGPG
jgi:hypothetical protein